MEESRIQSQESEQIQNSNKIEMNSLNSASFSNAYTYQTEYLSRAGLKEYIKYPMIYNAILREISLRAYNVSGLYSNVVDYLVSIPTLSYITIPFKKSSSKIKKKKSSFNQLFDLINHEKTTRDILRSLLINGMYVGILRDTTLKKNTTTAMYDFDSTFRRLEGLTLDDNFQIEPLDLDYCRVRGLVNNVYVAEFDMMYFDQYKGNGLMAEIKNYPEDFQVAYLAYRKDISKRWHMLDYKKTIVLKSKSSIDEPYGRPYGLSAFADMKMAEDYDDNQYGIIEELASSIYYMILPEGKEQGTCALNKDQQANQIRAFEGAVRASANGQGSKISTITLAPNTSLERLSKDASLLKDTLSDENMKKISTSLGFASSALNASSEGGASYSSLSVNLDLVSSQVFQLVNDIASEYTRIFNHHIGLIPKDYIKFRYLSISWLNKDSLFDKAKELYTLAGGSRKYLIASAGFNVEEYLAVLDEEIEDGLEEKYPPHQSTYTFDGTKDEGGAPLKKESELSPNGQTTRNLGSNKQVKPSTK